MSKCPVYWIPFALNALFPLNTYVPFTKTRIISLWSIRNGVIIEEICQNIILKNKLEPFHSLPRDGTAFPFKGADKEKTILIDIYGMTI